MVEGSGCKSGSGTCTGAVREWCGGSGAGAVRERCGSGAGARLVAVDGQRNSALGVSIADANNRRQLHHACAHWEEVRDRQSGKYRATQRSIALHSAP